MLIYRYLSRQLFASTLAVGFVLTLILVFGRFIRYLSDAADGKIQAEVLLSLLVFRMPGFLELILPMSLFMGILLACGRMYVDSEMTVLRASGVGNMHLIRLCLIPALMMAVVVGSFSLVLTPWGAAAFQNTMEEQRSRPQIDMISAGRFYKQREADVERTTYARDLVDNRTRLENVFLAEFPIDPAGSQRSYIVTAASGHRVHDDDGNEYLELLNGFRYEGQPGRPDYHVIAFETYRLRVSENVVLPSEEIRALPTHALIDRTDTASIAELQWRMSIPFMCLISVLLAVPLSRVNPREGRFLKLLPSVLLFLTYVGLLIGVRQWVERGTLPPAWGPWWVHAIFAALGLLLAYSEEIRLTFFTRRTAAGTP